MRRKRFQRGSLKTQKRRGKLRWYAQWREEGIPRSKELGVCNEVSRIAAEAMLQEFLKPINEGTERREKTEQTFEEFIELVYLPVYEQKWKDSTKDTETNRIRYHLAWKRSCISETTWSMGQNWGSSCTWSLRPAPIAS
jgi:hypothetical protein